MLQYGIFMYHGMMNTIHVNNYHYIFNNYYIKYLYNNIIFTSFHFIKKNENFLFKII